MGPIEFYRTYFIQITSVALRSYTPPWGDRGCRGRRPGMMKVDPGRPYTSSRAAALSPLLDGRKG